MSNWMHLRIGQPVRFSIPAGAFQGNYVSRLEDEDEDTLFFAAPTAKSALVPLHVGQRVQIYYVSDQPSGPAVYEFEGRVKGLKQEPVPLVLLPVPGSVTRKQQREFVRVECDLPVRFRPADQEKHPFAYRNGRCLDLSGGGLVLSASDPDLIPGSTWDVELALPEGKVAARAKVVRLVPRKDKSGYNAAMRFVVLGEPLRDRIMRYVFARQLELRRRQLI